MTTTAVIDHATRQRIEQLIERTARADGFEPLSEHKRMMLSKAEERRGRSGSDVGNAPRFGAVVSIAMDSGDLVGYGQVSSSGDGPSADLGIELVVDPGFRNEALGIEHQLLSGSLAEATQIAQASPQGRLGVRFWAPHADHHHDQLVEPFGLTVERDLFQMRCSLPVGGTRTQVRVRPFSVGKDELAWLTVNNRAFTQHPEQGSWTAQSLIDREHEEWFDPNGLLLLEDDGRIIGSCWTKIHRATAPPMGEIYVISVDPDYHGRGFGRALTLAGLDWLAGAGLLVGMLYVDSHNEAAMALYRSLGFTVDHQDRAYVGSVGRNDLPPSLVTEAR